VKAGGVRYDNFSGVVFSGLQDSEGEVSLPLVFAGNGTEQDFNQVDIKDKAVFFFSKESSLGMGRSRSVALAREKGARLILVNNTESAADFDAVTAQLRALSSGGRPTLAKPSVPVLQSGLALISPAAVEKIMGATKEQLKKSATPDASKNALKKIKPSFIQYKSEVALRIVKTENVLGYMEGTDKKEELVVVSAHYDHIGVLKNTTAADKINNGADDDGSGTVSVLELARIFAQAKREGKGPRRSILFMTVTGEEKGLLGSSYYTDHPVFPLEKTVVDLNIDMVGRRDALHKDSAPYVYVIGSDKLAADLHTLSEDVNRKNLNMLFDYTYNEQSHPERIYYRSDHWNFAKNNIPIIFYFDGIHEDYHRPGDEVDKIEFDLLAKRAQVIFYTAWEIANQEKRIVPDPDKMIKK
jgi:hypothetical protein